ncbi:MAG: VWA domain-containing protein [Sandaracinaceae bacterium]|nr:VWA domain-containing protein [Sandaracinaceae bacterium]
MKRDERLAELERRIEQVVLDPSSVRAPFTRLVRPILKGIGWRGKTDTRALERLLAFIGAVRDGDDAWPDKIIEYAVDELEDNLVAVERACVVNGRVGTARGAWLRRMFELVVHAIQALDKGDRTLRRMVAATDPTRILPPLAVREAKPDEAHPEAEGEPRLDHARLVELQLSAVDHLLDLARDERAFLARRRRLLEAARQVLLESSAAMPLDEGGVEARRSAIAREIVRIDRLEAEGLSPTVGLLHQARSALDRGERRKLWASLTALDGSASDAFDELVVRRTERALVALGGGPLALQDEIHEREIEASGRDTFGERVVERVREGYRRGRRDLDLDLTEIPAQYHAKAREYLASGAETATLSAALSVDGAFEVGGVLSPLRVLELELRPRVVAFPTPDLQLVPARSVEDVATAVISDPRTILLELATGRLLTRKYVEQERVERVRTRMVSEVRVYLLDGSTSMIGDRARTRDALLIAELSTLLQRFENARRGTRVTLFYRYFDLEPGPIVRVADPKGALDAIQDVVGLIRIGGTNIQAALLSSLAQIAEARAQDPDLARAQIVLVTDGAAPVNEADIAKAREALGDLAVGISVIALGEENEALRAMVARQRAAGERAFYHFVPDDALHDMARGRIDRGLSLRVSGPELGARLQEELRGLLDELADLERARDLESIERTEAELRASSDMLVTLDGEGARREAMVRDVRAIERRYARWFPPASREELEEPDDRSDADAVFAVLTAVAEIVSVVGGAPLARRAEAIEVLERLLPDAGISPARYRRVLDEFPRTVAPALDAIHAVVSPR